MSSSRYTPVRMLTIIPVVLALAALFVINRLLRMPIGRAWEALREDEIACRALGMNPTVIKLSAFTIGATFAAEIREDTVRGQKANWLVVRHYVVTKGASPERLQHVSDMRFGVLRYTSISFSGGAWEYVEGPGGDYFFRVDDSDEATGRDRLMRSATCCSYPRI